MTFKLDHEAEWASYEENVMPSDACDIQRRETKLTLLAGLASGYMNALIVMTGPDDYLINIARLEDEVAAIRNTLRGMGIPL